MSTAKPYAAQERFRQKQEESGLVRISTYVPEEDRDKALNYCAQLRKKQKRKGSA